jgi:hypothetical protein
MRDAYSWRSKNEGSNDGCRGPDRSVRNGQEQKMDLQSCRLRVREPLCRIPGMMVDPDFRTPHKLPEIRGLNT